MPAEADRIVAEVERAADEIVQYTADLVRIPTVNPPGDAYDACAHFIGDDLARRGLAVEYIERAGVTLPGTVEISGTVDEESGGFAGVAYLAANGRIAAGRTDFVII